MPAGNSDDTFPGREKGLTRKGKRAYPERKKRLPWRGKTSPGREKGLPPEGKKTSAEGKIDFPPEGGKKTTG
jgi:hypothetical protein